MYLFLGILFFTIVIIYFLDVFVFRKLPKWVSFITILILSFLLILTKFMHLIFVGLGVLIGSAFLLYLLKRPTIE